MCDHVATRPSRLKAHMVTAHGVGEPKASQVRNVYIWANFRTPTYWKLTNEKIEKRKEMEKTNDKFTKKRERTRSWERVNRV